MFDEDGDFVCPICEGVMFKGFIEGKDNDWHSVWFCDCHPDEFIKHEVDYDSTVVWISGGVPWQGESINDRMRDVGKAVSDILPDDEDRGGDDQ